MFKTLLLIRGLVRAGHSIKQSTLGIQGLYDTDDNFPAGVTGDPTMADPSLDWMLANKNGLGVRKLGTVLAAHEAVEIPF